MAIVDFDPDDPSYKSVAYGAAPATPARGKLPISPEMEKAVNDAGTIKALARAAASTATFGGTDWLAGKLRGTSTADEKEMGARIRELNPKASFAGDLTGGALQGMMASGGLAAAAPATLGLNTLRSAAMREGLGSLATGATDQAVKGEFSPGGLLAQTALGGALGGAGSQLPALFGHARTIASKVMPRPLEAVEQRAMQQAQDFAEHYNFRGDAGLDVAQRARLSEAPGLQEMAANAERLKNRAHVTVREPQEAAFRANRLDQLMEDSIPQPGSPRGPSRGGPRDYPVMSGREVGQSHHAFPDTTVFTPPRPLPASAEAGIDDSFARNRAMWHTQMQNRGTNRPQPQKYEFNQWEDILNRNKSRYPMSREDVGATRDIMADINPILRNRMHAEQRAEDVSRIRNAVRDAPATPDRIPDSIPLSIGLGAPPFLRNVPGLRHMPLPFLGASVNMPLPKPTGRYTRANDILNEPGFLELIGRMTTAQSATGGAAAGAASAPWRR